MLLANLDCPSSEPFTLRVGGPIPDEDRTSLLFTPGFPCGVERSPDFDPLDDAPLVRIATIRMCLSDGCDPNRLALIRGHVQSFDSVRGPGTIDPLNIAECEGASANPRVKLEIQPCGWPGGVIIDSDSEIVVPAGDTSINVLVPGPRVGGGAAGTGGWRRGRTTLAIPTSWTDVTLRIKAAWLDCCYCPEGVLTEYISGLTDASPNSSGVLVRPRRARRLEIHNQTTGVPFAVIVDLLGDFGAAAALSSTTFPVTPQTMNLPGAIQAIELRGTAAGVASMVKWEIR